MVEYSAYVGLDVHKDTISVAVALPGREVPVFQGEIRNQRSSLRRLIGRLSPDGEVVSFCYEAGPCGYGVYREIVATGHHCEVVAPSLIPRRAGDRVKTDRRDAVILWLPTRTVPGLTDETLHLDEIENRHEALVRLKERSDLLDQRREKFSLKSQPDVR